MILICNCISFNSVELSRLQEEQINIGRKIEKEQQRKDTLDNDIIVRATNAHSIFMCFNAMNTFTFVVGCPCEIASDSG